MPWWMMMGVLMAPEGDGGGGGGDAGGGDAGGDDTGGGGGEARDPVPYERFQQVVQQKNELAAWKEQHAPVVEQAQTWRSEAEQAQQMLQSNQATWDTERAIMQSGGILDADGIETAKMLFNRVPEAQRPEGGVAEWIGGLKGNPESAPVPLRPYFMDSGSGPSGGGGGGGGTGGDAGGGTGDGGGSGGPNGPVGEAMFAEAVEKGRRTNDWSDFNALKERWRKEQIGGS